MIKWKRTGNKEYPKEEQECFIYFFHTGFEKSVFTTEKIKELDCTVTCFSGSGGWLGDEDVLWISIEDYETGDIPEIPISYSEDKCFMKWDDPRLIIKQVKLKEDYLLRIKEISYEKQFYKDQIFGVVQELNLQQSQFWIKDCLTPLSQCIYSEGQNLEQIWLPTELCEVVE